MHPGESAGQQVTRRRARADQLRAQAAETIRRVVGPRPGRRSSSRTQAVCRGIAAHAGLRQLQRAAGSAPGGVARPGALNTGRKLQPAPAVTTSRLLYLANARLDTDSDGIACELVRSLPSTP